MFYGTVTSDIKSFLTLVGDPWVNVQEMSKLVPGLINLALVIATIVFFFLLLFGGIRWITAGGDKTSLESAQKMLTSAIVGIVIVLSAWAIKDFVWKFFGLSAGGASQFVCPSAVAGKKCKLGTKSVGPCVRNPPTENCCLCQSNGSWTGTQVTNPATDCLVLPGDCQ